MIVASKTGVEKTDNMRWRGKGLGTHRSNAATDRSFTGIPEVYVTEEGGGHQGPIFVGNRHRRTGRGKKGGEKRRKARRLVTHAVLRHRYAIAEKVRNFRTIPGKARRAKATQRGKKKRTGEVDQKEKKEIIAKTIQCTVS